MKYLSLIALLAACLFFQPITAVAAGPKIVVPEPAYQFGAVREDEKITHDFVVKNEGDEKLTIDKVVTS